MNVQPTVEIHPHQEFHFAKNTDSSGCCCCWKSKSKKPKEYHVKKNGTFHPIYQQRKNSSASLRKRIIANERLASLVASKFERDPIQNHDAFEELKDRVTHDFDFEAITDEKLIEIINAMYEIKREIKEVCKD